MTNMTKSKKAKTATTSTVLTKPKPQLSTGIIIIIMQLTTKVIVFLGFLLPLASTFQAPRMKSSTTLSKKSSLYQSSTSIPSSSSSSSWFSDAAKTPVGDNSDKDTPIPLETLKAQILQLGCTLDRGQAYNPTSGSYYKDTMEQAKNKIQQLVTKYPKPPKNMQEIEGEWELVLTTVSHGIFRSSPFFLAIQEAYEKYAEEKGTVIAQSCIVFNCLVICLFD